jgi:DNA repair exonuclease SbcCD ATPase subunit
MRIKQATIRNYRLHQHIKVDFHPKLQLIGGRNESGKSTIVEAIHRCLFLKAKGQTDDHRLMEPHSGSGTPEVELILENAGKEYRILKKFAGTKGVVEFDEIGVSRLSGDPADEAISQLLKTTSGVSGKVLAASWAHLWIEQGQSFNDPTAPSKLPAEQLNARLRTLGGTALSSSHKDAALAKRFLEERGKIFKGANEDFKDGSAAGKAETAMATAKERFESAKENLEKIRDAIDGLERATRDTAATMSLLEEQDAAANQLRAQQLEFTRLDSALKGEETESAVALRKLQDLQETTKEIAETKASMAAAEKDAAPAKLVVESAEATRLEAVTNYETAKSEFAKARNNLELARISEELAEAYLDKLQLEKAIGAAKVASKELDTLRAQLATLPDLSEKEFKILQKAEREANTARLSLEALSARVKLISGPQSIQVGKAELKVGQDLLISQPTLISTQDGSQIQFSPGGEDLPAMQKKAEETETQLASLLLKHRVSSFTEAEKLRADRARIEQTLEIKSSQDGASASDSFAAELKAAENSISGHESSLARLGGVLPKFDNDLDALARHVAGLKQRTKDAKSVSLRLEAMTEAADLARTKADQSLKKARDKMSEDEASVSALKVKLSLLEKAYPDSKALAEAIDSQTKALALATLKVRATKDTLAKLPPNLDLEINRLERAIGVTRTKQSTAEKEAIQFSVQARANGVNDPNEQFELLRAEYERAQQVFRGVSDQANAIKLLADTYKAATQALDAQYTQPLLERVGVYLASMFEHGARLELKKEGEGFAEPTLVRPNSKDPYPTPFESLSGGAKEQVATAIRLATAEILAENFGGSLPIVFDDAFAFTDRQRVQQVIRMLDLGANRGLQIILLSCTHEDYANLGAQEYVIK